MSAGRAGRGTNLNQGPAPVRTLARAARLARDWSSWERFGLEGSRPVPNLGARVLGEYSAETVQVVAAVMSAGQTVEQLAEIQFAFPTFTEAVSMARPDGLPHHRHRTVPAILELPRIP